MVKKRNRCLGRYTYYAPIAGFSRNGLVDWERNSPCFCGSKLKFKKCCLRRIPRYIPEELALRMLKTPENRVALFLEWYFAEIKAKKTQEPLVSSNVDTPEFKEVSQDELDDIFKGDCG